MSKLKLLLLLWLMLIGFASGYSQEIVKCIVIETNSGGFIECNLTKHPKLTQNNNVVTLTTDESVTEFSTTDFKKVYFGEDKTLYKLSYFVDGESYKIHKYEVGESITPEAEPTKEGYTFSGWSDIPATMPANDITVTGTFSVNKYKLVYKVDGQEYKSYDVEYGATITPETEPTKEGYTFSGWSDIPATMPAKDIVITGTYVTGINGVVYNSVLLYNNDGYYTLNGLDAKEPVLVYAASGEIILRYTASEKGELNIRSSLLSTGVNIIKTKNQSFKVIRK